jgi:hypothetical protein
LAQLDFLDRKEKTNVISLQEAEYKSCLHAKLTKFLRGEELYWLQRSKATRLVHDDDNTKYFQLLANGRYRKTGIYQLEQEEGVIVGEENLKTYITNFYKGLFGSPESNHFTLDETHIEDIPQVSDLENEILSGAFSENEIKEAMFQMEHNKAPRPDGFPAEFYQYFWDIIKPDLLALFNEFHQGTLPLHCLNFGIITFLPKKA